jgi:hypothetical protein
VVCELFVVNRRPGSQCGSVIILRRLFARLQIALEDLLDPDVEQLLGWASWVTNIIDFFN